MWIKKDVTVYEGDCHALINTNNISRFYHYEKKYRCDDCKYSVCAGLSDESFTILARFDEPEDVNEFIQNIQDAITSKDSSDSILTVSEIYEPIKQRRLAVIKERWRHEEEEWQENLRRQEEHRRQEQLRYEELRTEQERKKAEKDKLNDTLIMAYEFSIDKHLKDSCFESIFEIYNAAAGNIPVDKEKIYYRWKLNIAGAEYDTGNFHEGYGRFEKYMLSQLKQRIGYSDKSMLFIRDAYKLANYYGKNLNVYLSALNFYRAQNERRYKVLAAKGKKNIDVTMTTIEDMGFSVRAYNALKRAGVNTLAELNAKSEKELIESRNIGKKTREEIEQKLQSYLIDYFTS